MRARARRRVHPDSATVVQHDAAGDGKALPRAATDRFGREERLEQSLTHVVGHAGFAETLALGDLFWQYGDIQRAVSAYFRVLSEIDPMQPVALARTGESLPSTKGQL